MAYLNLQNKALHQGLYLSYVELPTIASGMTYTTNGHIMVRGKVEEVKTINSQEDRRKGVTVITDREWLSDLKELDDTDALLVGEQYVEANRHNYQRIYIQYVMARYPVAEWKTTKVGRLVALDENNNIIAVIAPLVEGESNELVK